MTSQEAERMWRGTIWVLGAVAGSIFYQLCKAAVESSAVDPADLFDGFPMGFSFIMLIFLAREPGFRPQWPTWAKYLLLFAFWLIPILFGVAYLVASALSHGNWERFEQEGKIFLQVAYLVVGFSYWTRLTFPKFFNR